MTLMERSGEGVAVSKEQLSAISCTCSRGRLDHRLSATVNRRQAQYCVPFAVYLFLVRDPARPISRLLNPTVSRTPLLSRG